MAKELAFGVAGDASKVRHNRIKKLLKRLTVKIEKFAKEASKNVEDWEYAGELGHIEEALEGLIRRMPM